jgi:S1-C subfamily serine protease
MRSVLLLLLVGMLSLACAGPVPTAAAPSASNFYADDAADLASKTIALVVRLKDGEVRAYCSGVWVAPKLILTANHCMHDLELNDRVEYVVRDDVYAPGELKERPEISSHGAMLSVRDVDHDLALLYAPAAPDHGVAAISGRVIHPGMSVQAMGQPLGLWWSYSRGDVAAVREVNSTGTPMLFVQTTTPISPGSSGGALFDLMGQVVGICHGTFTRGQNVNLFIHYQYIGALLMVQGRF